MNNEVTKYIQSFDSTIAARLQALREFILKTVPNAQETISYAMPAYKVDKKILIYFSGYAGHIGMYPGRIESYDFSERVKKYASGKSTLRFSNDEPLPFDVIKELLQHRLAQVQGRD